MLKYPRKEDTAGARQSLEGSPRPLCTHALPLDCSQLLKFWFCGGQKNDKMQPQEWSGWLQLPDPQCGLVEVCGSQHSVRAQAHSPPAGQGQAQQYSLHVACTARASARPPMRSPCSDPDHDDGEEALTKSLIPGQEVTPHSLTPCKPGAW